jgi:hypothetical protein
MMAARRLEAPHEGEIIAQRNAPLVTRVRSTLLCSGIAVFRTRGLFDRYVANLAPAPRDALLGAIAGTWLPIDVAMAHFAAVEALGLSPDEAFAIGASSGERIQKSVLQTLVRLAAGAGANPWTVFFTYPRLWERIFDGGGFAIKRLGPKEAELDIRMLPMSRYAYFRHAFAGANYVGLGLFARKVYVNVLAKRSTDTSCAMRVSWV